MSYLWWTSACLNLPRKSYGSRKGVGIFLSLNLTSTPSPPSLWPGPSPTVSHCYGLKFYSRIQLPFQFLSHCSLLTDLPVWLSLVYLLYRAHLAAPFPLLSSLVIFVSIINSWTPNIPVPTFWILLIGQGWPGKMTIIDLYTNSALRIISFYMKLFSTKAPGQLTQDLHNHLSIL